MPVVIEAWQNIFPGIGIKKHVINVQRLRSDIHINAGIEPV